MQAHPQNPASSLVNFSHMPFILYADWLLHPPFPQWRLDDYYYNSNFSEPARMTTHSKPFFFKENRWLRSLLFKVFLDYYYNSHFSLLR